MGILSRWHFLKTPRGQGSGRLWDNVNVPSSKGPASSTVTQFTMPAETNAFVRGPNPEPNLQGHQYKDPFRVRARHLHLQPEIPVEEPWATSSVYIQEVNSAPGQVKNQVPKAPPQGQQKALASPTITQRDLLYDAANPRTLQRGTFITASQQYFNQRTPLPEYTTPSVPTNMVIAGNGGTPSIYPVESQTGWEQRYVPEIQMYEPFNASASPWLLSTPLNVRQITISEGHRQPVIGKAPKRKKTAGA